MIIELLGDNCHRCGLLEKNINRALKNSKTEVKFQKVGELGQIAEYGLLSLPGLAVNGRIMSAGKLLSEKAIGELMASCGMGSDK